jgi:hypothetical protein
VKKQDVRFAYSQMRIIIKLHARCCSAHLQENGLLKKEQFNLIPVRNMPYSSDTIKMYDALDCDNVSVFDAFKDLKYLEDSHCKNITGWSKKEFIEFSDMLTSICNTKNRTKEQLLALYRYWLRNKITEQSLAYMFGNKMKQYQISRFLQQIRKCINNDVVPYYLGAKQDREFYLKYKTNSTSIIHDLEKDHLALVADGTYCKIEKSANNSFQYKTYSGQKNDSLIKPFLVCCADGYIVDCYGPFQANVNDSKILDFVIENDEDLKKLLIPNKTLLLLDRGKLILELLLI